MSISDGVFGGVIPEIYDTYLVPLIFESFAGDLAVRAACGAPYSVLETAAGSGVVARALAPRLPSNARYFVTDLNRPVRLCGNSARCRQPHHMAASRRTLLAV